MLDGDDCPNCDTGVVESFEYVDEDTGKQDEGYFCPDCDAEFKFPRNQEV